MFNRFRCKFQALQQPLEQPTDQPITKQSRNCINQSIIVGTVAGWPKAVGYIYIYIYVYLPDLEAAKQHVAQPIASGCANPTKSTATGEGDRQEKLRQLDPVDGAIGKPTLRSM